MPDYNLQLLTKDEDRLRPFDADVHTYSGEASLRCFHVNLSKLSPGRHREMRVRLMASSGTQRVGYYGVGTDKVTLVDQVARYDQSGVWDAQFTLPAQVSEDVSFFYPSTTTLVEVVINREPLPLVGANQVLRWD